VVKATEFYDDRDDDSTVWYKSLMPQYRRIPTKDLPKGVKVGFSFKTMTVNPVIFLPWVRKELESRSVRFIRKEVKDIEEVKRLTGNEVVVHASGLGASNLAGDKDVVAARGQTMFVKTDFNELMMFQGSEYTYIIPRMHSGGVIIGGVSQEGNHDREVDQKLRPDILARVKNISKDRLESVDLESPSTKDIVGFRPGRKGGYRLESEGVIVHAYGFGGMGYIYGYGAALKVRDLVESVMKREKLRSRL
jgi:D-amino-acid oxidase